MKHLFMLMMDNSGSRVVLEYLKKCENVVALEKEGQEFFGNGHEFGPNNHFDNVSFYNEAPSYQDPTKYDWPKIKEFWNGNWGEKQEGKVYLEKSNPDIMRHDMLNREFDNAHFLVGTRNPYAILEGKMRTTGIYDPARAALYWVECAEEMYEALYKYGDRAFLFSYEDMCDYSDVIITRMKNFLPELHDLSFGTHTLIPSGRREDKALPLTNMNEAKIKDLTQDQIDGANEVFRDYQEVLHRFGYTIMETK